MPERQAQPWVMPRSRNRLVNVLRTRRLSALHKGARSRRLGPSPVRRWMTMRGGRRAIQSITRSIYSSMVSTGKGHCWYCAGSANGKMPVLFLWANLTGNVVLQICSLNRSSKFRPANITVHRRGDKAPWSALVPKYRGNIAFEFAAATAAHKLLKGSKSFRHI